jgi:hypothetical protein
MTFVAKLLVVVALAGLIAMAIVARVPITPAGRDRPGTQSGARVTACVALLAIALILVGVVSDTLVRHLVQVAALLCAFVLLVAGRTEWGVAAAAPLFAFWLLIMAGIWAFLLGVARIFTGTFSTVEILLTVVIALLALTGLAATSRTTASSPRLLRLAVVLLFLVLQVAAMWMSVQPVIART